MTSDFSPYSGDPQTRALQMARDAQVADLRDTPGAVIHARAFSSDDPEQLGWNRLRRCMSEEGMVTLRGVDDTTIEAAKSELKQFEPKLHFWDLFMADAQRIEDVCGAIIDQGLPEGIHLVNIAKITPSIAKDVQAFLSRNGVSPFSTDALLGTLFPARLVVLQGPDGTIAASGFAAMTHNLHSPFFNIAWVGLIAVDPSYRGLGLGKLVDAYANLAAVTELEAKGTMEFVARDNAPSRAMLESCGLRQVEGKFVVVLSTSADRITR